MFDAIWKQCHIYRFCRFVVDCFVTYMFRMFWWLFNMFKKRRKDWRFVGRVTYTTKRFQLFQLTALSYWTLISTLKRHLITFMLYIDLSCLMASVFLSFSSQVSLSSAISFSDICKSISSEDFLRNSWKNLLRLAVDSVILRKMRDYTVLLV